MKTCFMILLLLAVLPVYAQKETDIVTYLKQIESGESDKVKKTLPELKSKNPNDPSILFLEAVLTEDGNKAVSLFENIIVKHPQSKYADASLYRISSFWYAVEDHEKAKNYFTKLKKEYPSSPYIKLADRKFISLEEEPKQNVRIKKDEKNYRFTIQAGAFGNVKNAESLKKDLSDSGFTSEIKEKIVAGSIFQVVYVGKFLNEEEARDQLEIINKKFGLSGRVTGIN